MNINEYTITTGIAFLVLLLIWLLGVGFAVALPLLAVTVSAIVALTHYSNDVPDLVPLFGGGLAILFLLLPAPGWITFWGMLLGVGLILSALVGRNGSSLRNAFAGGLYVAGALFILGATALIVAQTYPEKTNDLLSKTDIEYRFHEDEGSSGENRPDQQPTGVLIDLQKSSWEIVTPRANGLSLEIRTKDDRATLSYKWSSNGEVGKTIIQIRSADNALQGRFKTAQAGSIGPVYGTVEIKKKFSNCFTGTMKAESGQRAKIAVRKVGTLCRP